MKKILILLMLISISNLSVIADESVSVGEDSVKVAHSKVYIEDDLIKSNSFPKIMPVFIKQTDPIVDELMESYEQTGSTLKLWARKDVEKDNQIINDELVAKHFKSGFASPLNLSKRKTRIDDKLALQAPVNRVRRIKVKNNYDFTRAQIPVQLKIIKPLSTKNKISEGDEILFVTTKDVVIKDEYIPKGTRVIGRIETISASDKMGTPANIIVDNFYVEGRPELCLYGNVSKTGANRSIWVYPLYQAGNIMFYVAGFAFVPIHGGHAKILTNDKFTVYYELN